MTEMQLNQGDEIEHINHQNGRNSAIRITNSRPGSRINTPSGVHYGSNGVTLPMDSSSEEETPLLDPNGRYVHRFT